MKYRSLFNFLFYSFLLVEPNTVASLYGPSCPIGAPALLLRRSDLRLVAVGASQGMDADRLILRRAVLTGDPFRIHK